MGRHVRDYVGSGALQQYYAASTNEAAHSFLEETMSNAMRQSDDVRVAINITTDGILIDVDQGPVAFPAEFLEDIRSKAADVLHRLERTNDLHAIADHIKHSVRRTIGYVPPNLGQLDGRPYRGNGIANTLINPQFRINYVAGSAENHTISLHTAAQLTEMARMHAGDKGASMRLYAPSEAEVRATSIDDLFASGDFDFRK